MLPLLSNTSWIVENTICNFQYDLDTKNSFSTDTRGAIPSMPTTLPSTASHQALIGLVLMNLRLLSIYYWNSIHWRYIGPIYSFCGLYTVLPNLLVIVFGDIYSRHHVSYNNHLIISNYTRYPFSMGFIENGSVRILASLQML
jgi:hypothetical protein